MSLTQGEWTYKTVNGRMVLECDIIQTTGETDAYTLKTPVNLDTTKPWILMVNTENVSLDGATLAVDGWAGYANGFVLSGQASVVATNGYEIQSAPIQNVKSAMNGILVNPNYFGTHVQSVAGTTGVINLGKFPHYAFNLDGGGTLNAGTCHYVIIQ